MSESHIFYFLEDMAFSVEFNSWYGKFALLIIFEII